MDEQKQKLKGSPLRDEFKQRHKLLRRDLYVADIDLMLVSKPQGITGFIDLKRFAEPLTFAEVLAYNHLLKVGFRVFIVVAYSSSLDKFDIQEYLGGNWQPKPPPVKLKALHAGLDWKGYERWEVYQRLCREVPPEKCRCRLCREHLKGTTTKC